MAYTQPKGQGSPASKTGAGIPSALTMTGSPAKQTSQSYLNTGAKIKRDADGTAPVTEDSSYMNQLRGNIPAAKGQLYTRPDGKQQYPGNSSAGDILDADNDGDTVFNDSNDDGTMASRGLFALVNAITGK